MEVCKHEEQVEILQCLWRGNAFHNEEKCRIVKRGNLYYHEYYDRAYSVHPTEGKPIVYTTDKLKLTVSLFNFNLNSNTCDITSLPFGNGNDFVHLCSFVPKNATDFWNIVRNLMWFWDNLIRKDLPNNVWPSFNTVTDLVILENKPNVVIPLRPVTFSPINRDYYRGLQYVLLTLFNNVSLNNDINHTNIKRSNRSKIKCNRSVYDKEHEIQVPVKCKLVGGCAGSIYTLFGKNTYVHSLCCILAEELNLEWYEFFKATVEYRWNETISFYDYRDIDDGNDNRQLIKCHSDDNCGRNIKDLIKKYNKWTDSVGIRRIKKTRTKKIANSL